jgi:hypothetical protein
VRWYLKAFEKSYSDSNKLKSKLWRYWLLKRWLHLRNDEGGCFDDDEVRFESDEDDKYPMSRMKLNLKCGTSA